jgi:hypothetical protein
VKTSLDNSTARYDAKISVKRMVMHVTPSVSIAEILAEISSNFVPTDPTGPTLKLVAPNSFHEKASNTQGCFVFAIIR